MLAAVLLLAFAALSLLHALLFRDVKNLAYYLLLDFAFIPLQVLVVSLILDRILSRREKSVLLKKLNMVIGAFFSEVGMKLLAMLAGFLPDIEKVRSQLLPSAQWSEKEFQAAARFIKGSGLALQSGRGSLPALYEFLSARTDFILRLLENSNLLEHDSFADLLWAVLHVAEELAARPSLAEVEGPDAEHLSGDLTRAYGQLLNEWIAYLGHLKLSYPYLYSLAVRTNPFDPAASARVV